MTTVRQVFDDDQMKRIVSEFSRLSDRCYLENAGAALYPQCLIKLINEDLIKNVYMNPHTDKYTRDCVEQIRILILRHFNTNSENYAVIFTSGTTESLKKTVESFQFNEQENGSFVYLRDNHTSVLGLREIAADKNADVFHISPEDFQECIKLHQRAPKLRNQRKTTNTLFVYPAESNFNGYKYPLDCVDKIKDGCLNGCLKKTPHIEGRKWYILLDAACYLPTNKLDLSLTQPDFVCLSFYKIFGYPTGLGALLIKKNSANVLTDKSYFGGGTVDVVLSTENFHVKRESLVERFEDGTSSFLSILALKHCFDVMHKLIPKSINNDVMETISHHTFLLAKDLYNQLKGLTHKNGRPAAVLYMNSDFSDMKRQGAIVTFNIMREDGSYIGYTEFQNMADLFGVDLRTGCFCNSGSCQRHLRNTNKEIKEAFKAGHKCGDDIDLIEGRPTGAVRASFAYYNTFADVDKLVAMICRCFVKVKFVRPERNFVSFNIIPEIKRDSYTEYAETYNTLVPFIPRYETKAILKEIVIFPIKSCGAFKINSAWIIGSKGFEYDREWMIVKDNGVCVTQKQNTRMCMLKPKIDLKRGILILTFPEKEPISIPLDNTNEARYKGMFCQSRICTDTINGHDCGDDVADWISEALETSYLRLIRQATDDRRVQKIKNKDEDKRLLSLSNQAQFLLINKATVRWLKDKIKDPDFNDSVDELTDRFRGNLIVDTNEVLVERDWHKIAIGNHIFKVESQCSRCQMVCIDQKNGLKTVEPLRTIAEEFAGKLRFGIYLSYLGPMSKVKDPFLQVNVPIKSIVSNEDDVISR